MSTKIQNLKVSQAFQGFVLSLSGRHLSTHTITDYNTTFRKFREYMGKDYYVEDITSVHISAFLASQTTVKNKTVRNYHTGLSSFWTWMVKEQIASEQIVHKITPPKAEQREIVPYKEEEIRSMLSSLERSKRYQRKNQRVSDHGIPYAERNRAVILLLLDTGIRAEELCSIKLHQLDKRNQRIKVFGKGAKERYVSFSDRTHQALWRYLVTRPDADEGEPVFLTNIGRKFRRDRLLKLLVRIGKRAGVGGVTVHRFRHTFAIQYLRNGGDPYTLQKMLGHSTLEMVKRYLAIAQTDVENVHRRASPVGNWAL